MKCLYAFLFTLFTSTLIPSIAFSVDIDRRVPNEYETEGGHSLGFGNSGVAATGGLAAIRINPGMLPLETKYDVSAGYNWPTAGREFYQVGVVDSRTSKIAAGLIYTGFTGKYDLETADEKDSPVERRGTLAIGKAIGTISAGIGVQYLEAFNIFNTAEENSKIKGTSIGGGFAGLLTPSLRFGASVENLANKKIKDFAPATIRAGIAYLFANGNFSTHLDFRQRERVFENDSDFDIDAYSFKMTAEEKAEVQSEVDKENKKYENPERMMIASVSAKVYDMIRILGGYGTTIMGPERSTLSGGLAIVHGNTSFSYTTSKPYLNKPSSQQALNLSFAVEM